MDCRAASSEAERLSDIALDLVGLTARPEKVAKVSKSKSRFGREVLGLVMVSRMSSANSDNLCEVPATSTPAMSG